MQVQYDYLDCRAQGSKYVGKLLRAWSTEGASVNSTIFPVVLPAFVDTVPAASHRASASALWLVEYLPVGAAKFITIQLFEESDDINIITWYRLN